MAGVEPTHPYCAAVEQGASMEQLATLFAPAVVCHAPILAAPITGHTLTLSYIARAATLIDHATYTLLRLVPRIRKAPCTSTAFSTRFPMKIGATMGICGPSGKSELSSQHVRAVGADHMSWDTDGRVDLIWAPPCLVTLFCWFVTAFPSWKISFSKTWPETRSMNFFLSAYHSKDKARPAHRYIRRCASA
jgi:hypothetical protein